MAGKLNAPIVHALRGKEFIEYDNPYDVVVNRQELSLPPSIKLDQMIGFSLYMIKAVLSGRGDEIIDLAKTNVIR